MFKLFSTEQVTEIIENLLKNLSSETTTTLTNVFIELCRSSIHFPVIKLLLQDPRVDPSVGMRLAIVNNNPEVSELLLQNPRTDPNQCVGSGNSFLEYASEYNYVKLVELLLLHDKINPCTQSNYAIRWASRKGHIEVVKLLLKHNKVDPTDRNNEAILSAMKKNHMEIVKLLIPRTDMSKITSPKILELAKELELEKAIQLQQMDKINNYINPIGATGSTGAAGNNGATGSDGSTGIFEGTRYTIPDMTGTNTVVGIVAASGTTIPNYANFNGQSYIIACGGSKEDSIVEFSTVNTTQENKFITDFINSFPAKTPFEIHYVDRVLTVKYKV
jgi:hypothetical protein